jgi:ATP-dependent Clp endopeptidase proteolytic subunit ClpP
MQFRRENQMINCEEDKKDSREPEGTMPIHLDTIVEDFLARTRRLLLVGEINEIASTHVCSYLQVYSTGTAPVYMYINSPGGCIAAGYAIVDQMLACRCPIVTIVRGQAHSMGAMIAAYGQKGHRFATPNSSLMLHSISIQHAPCPIEQQTGMVDYANMDYHDKVTNLSKRMKINKKKLTDLMGQTMWMSPKQAIKIGLIDGIWTPTKERAVSRSFDR